MCVGQGGGAELAATTALPCHLLTPAQGAFSKTCDAIFPLRCRWKKRKSRDRMSDSSHRVRGEKFSLHTPSEREKILSVLCAHLRFVLSNLTSVCRYEASMKQRARTVCWSFVNNERESFLWRPNWLDFEVLSFGGNLWSVRVKDDLKYFRIKERD